MSYNSPTPLDFTLPPGPLVNFNSLLIVDTWRRLAQRLSNRGVNHETLANMREAYVTGLYAASAAVTTERADAKSISEAAYRIEKMR